MKEPDATEREKKIYEDFVSRRETTLETMKGLLTDGEAKARLASTVRDFARSSI